VEQHRIFLTTRRTVLAGIVTMLGPGPRVAGAQSREGPHRLGVLMTGAENDQVEQTWAAALLQGLAALDWHDGGNLRIEWRWCIDPTLFERYAAELVAFGPEVILAVGNAPVEALRRQTDTVPIVFAIVSDPVGSGYVESLAHPGGNITGFSSYDPPMAGKWLGMLTQITPPVARVAVLYNPETTPYAGLMLRTLDEAARAFAVAVRAAPVHDDAEIETTIAALAREGHSGLLVLQNLFTTAHRDAIIALAARDRVPAVYPWPFYAKAGGLMSYGIDQPDLFRRSATYVNRILKGAKPSDLPVQRPTKFELVINLKTAKALGITIAPSLLNNADEVIE
jgi:putative ABC transport system substrate-binding protein